MNEQRSEFGTVSMKKLFRAIFRKLWLVCISAVAGAVAVFLFTYFFVTPLYEASAMFYVNNGSISLGDTSVSISSGDITASKSLVDTYIVILQTRQTLDTVKEETGLSYSYSQLKDMIKAEAVNETEIFRVVVTSPSPEEAERIANTIADVLPVRISTIVEGTSSKVVDAAVVPSQPSSPSYANNTVLGFLLGLVLCVGIIVLRELFNVSVRGEEDISQVCHHPILASIPNMAAPTRGGYYYGYGDSRKKHQSTAGESVIGGSISFAASEAYKLLRTNLQYSFAAEKECRVIGVSSAISGEGKSVTAVNLAYSMAQLNRRVLLIDCDMRKPTIAEKLAINRKPGLSGLLTGQCALTDALQRCVVDEQSESFYAIAAGQTPPNPVELLGSPKMASVLEAVRQKFDYVILDLPPVCEVSDALAVNSCVDGFLFVIRQNRCNRIALKDALQRFDYVDAKILGVIYNSVEEGGGRYGKKYEKKYTQSYASTDRRNNKQGTKQ